MAIAHPRLYRWMAVPTQGLVSEEILLTVCSFLWDDNYRQRNYTFNENHVVTLRNMVQRHLSLDHEFVCVTDRRHIGDGIRCIPLDDRCHVPGSCGRKLTIWAPDAAERIGQRILSLDLDIVIVDGITPLADRPEDVVMLKNPNYTPNGGRAFFQGSFQLIKAGSRPWVWELFHHPVRQSLIGHDKARFGGFEQAWLSEVLPWDEAYLTQADGIWGAGRIGDWTDDVVHDKLPGGSRIIVFPGNREPSQSFVQDKFRWVSEHYK